MHEKEVKGTLSSTLEKIDGYDPEKLLEITYQPQARFKVQAVTRCTSSIPGMIIISLKIFLKRPSVTYKATQILS